jgi:hypothetical protein
MCHSSGADLYGMRLELIADFLRMNDHTISHMRREKVIRSSSETSTVIGSIEFWKRWG